MSDLVEHLNEARLQLPDRFIPWPTINEGFYLHVALDQAADTLTAKDAEIARLTAEVERLRGVTVKLGENAAKAAKQYSREVKKLRAEVADWKVSFMAFGATTMVAHAQDCGLPKDHLHPLHYDLLAKAGARMDSFTRADEALGGHHEPH